jgi:Bacterial Ig-like domain (group 3)
MAIESAVLLRRIASNACLIPVVGLFLSGMAPAQLPIKAPVPVTVGSVIPFGHGSTGQWSQIYSVKVAHNGSVLFLDTAVSNLYQWAPGAAAPTLAVGPAPTGQSSNGSTLEASGSFWNSGMALDANDTLYITDRYGSAVHFLRVPYNAASGTWTFNSASNWANSPSITLSGVPTAISPQDVSINCDNGFPCTMVVSWSNTGEIDKFTIDANGNPGTVTRVITGMLTNGNLVAQDHAGNIFFLENAYSSPSSRVTGVREIPATATLPLAGDGTGTLESKLTRIDPASAGFNFKGMTFDAAGNLYLSSENDQNSYGGQVNLLLMVPNEGTPAAPNLVWNDAVQVSPVAAGFAVAIDPRGYIWIPNGNGGSNWAPGGTKAPPCTSLDPATCTTSGIVQWAPGSASLGASPVGTAGTTQTVFYSFSKATTPGSFTYAQPGAGNFTTIATNPNPDPTVTPAVPACTAGTAYPAFASQETVEMQNSWCAFYVQLNTTTTGSVTGELQILDSSKNIIAGSNVYLNGIGEGAAVSVLSPIGVQAVAKGLQAPEQAAGDSQGNSYVADSTLGVVEMYPAGSNSVVGTALGAGLTAPTGVAVDGAGDVYIGDSGNVIEIPFINGALATKQQTTLQTGLGDHLNLAADGAGNVYVADMDKKQVVKLSNPQVSFLLQDQGINTIGAGVTFTGPSAIATDNLGNVWVADGSKLWELTPSGASNEITSALSAPVTGLAVDPSGSVFVSESTGLFWIPYETSSGGLNVNGALQVADTLGSGSLPVSVALDGMENAYATYGSGSTAGMSQLGVGGTIDFGQIVPFAESDQEAQIFNLGNAPLTLSAFSGDLFTGANAADYSVGSPNDAPACGSATPLLAGTACYFDIALTPSAAGLSSASVAVLSDAANAPAVNIALSANAVVDPRNASSTTVVITPSSGINYPGAVTVTVTVAGSAAGSATPSGTATLAVTGQKKASQTLVNGVATFSYTGLLGGNYTAVADYGGEGVAGTTPDFAASGGKAKFTVNTIPPALALGTPGCGPASATSCTLNPDNVTVWAGNTYINVASQTTITATVTSTAGTPTGTVSFLQNGKPVDPTQPTIALDANGNAVFSTANLPVGVYNLTAVYNGDVNFSTVNFALPAFQVIVPSLQITATPNTTSITAGVPDQVTLTLKPLVGFNQQVNVQCVTATMPNWSECTFNNPEIGVGNGSDPTAVSTIVVTISTNVPVNGGTSSSIVRQSSWTMACLFGLGLMGIIAGRKKVKRHLNLICLAVMISGVFMGITACTNAGYSTPPPAPTVKTPAGTYAVQIITVNPQTGLQNSLTTPLFVLSTTVQ